MVEVGESGVIPTEEDIAFFHEHGWWVSGEILSDDMLAELEYEFSRYQAGETDQDLPEPILPQWSQGEGSSVKQADYLSLQLDGVLNFVKDPLLPEIAARLAQTSAIRLFHDQLVYKCPTNASEPHSTVGWHTDRAYWRSCKSEKMLTAWIPLQDTPVEMGPLAVWDHSHKWPGAELMHSFDEIDLKEQELAATLDGRVPEVEILDMKRGQVSFHHCRLVHGSYGNHTESARLGFAIHYQDVDNQRKPETPTSGKPLFHLNDVLCRKGVDELPDYADPEICPQLWPPLA